ncbi:SWAHB protein, partial [Geococcyx californianus]|nr:SWAHB protein [Geococcyx californianus]
SHLGAAPSSPRMARELSQEAVLDFLWGAGGRAPNSALLRHFQRFLRDPALSEHQRRERREYFKSLVNSLATVRPAAGPGASKDIVLRRRYRDLLDEDLQPPEQQETDEEEKPPTGMSLPKAAPLSAGPGRQRPSAASRSPQPPPLWSLPLQSAPGVLCLSRSLQELPTTPSPPLFSGPDVLPCTRLPPSQSKSLQQLPTRPSCSPPRASRLLTPNGPTRSQELLLYPYQTLPLPSDPLTRPPSSQSPTQSSTQPSPSQHLKPPPARPTPSQSLLPAAGPQATGSSPPASLPVFRSIRCQLALLEVRGTPPPLPNDCRRQPHTVPSKSSPRKVPSRGLSVPLGQREHAWLVAASAGCWARVRGLFLEEPELALQRDFMSGFTVLHWLAKHGDGPGLQELAAAAQQVGLALDVDVRSSCGYTPLHLAAIHGHQFVIKVLVLQLGCQVQVRDSSGRRPWEYLGSSTSGEIWQLLEAP